MKTLTAYCVKKNFTEPLTVADRLERYKEWELDMRFGTWNL
jgi:hypothetical protein